MANCSLRHCSHVVCQRMGASHHIPPYQQPIYPPPVKEEIFASQSVSSSSLSPTVMEVAMDQVSYLASGCHAPTIALNASQLGPVPTKAPLPHRPHPRPVALMTRALWRPVASLGRGLGTHRRRRRPVAPSDPSARAACPPDPRQGVPGAAPPPQTDTQIQMVGQQSGRTRENRDHYGNYEVTHIDPYFSGKH